MWRGQFVTWMIFIDYWLFYSWVALCIQRCSEIGNIHRKYFSLFSQIPGRKLFVNKMNEEGTTKDNFYQIKCLQKLSDNVIFRKFCQYYKTFGAASCNIRRRIFLWFVGNPVESSREIQLSWAEKSSRAGNKSSTTFKVPFASQFSQIITHSLQICLFSCPSSSIPTLLIHSFIN